MTNLIQYRVFIQYFSPNTNNQESLPNLVSNEKIFIKYKKAKKYMLKSLNDLSNSNIDIYKAIIEPVMLEENFLN